MASPMNLSSVPPWRNTVSVCSVRYRLRSATTSSAGRDSDSEVKPRMSEKSTVTTRVSLLMSSSFTPSATRFFTTRPVEEASQHHLALLLARRSLR